MKRNNTIIGWCIAIAAVVAVNFPSAKAQKNDDNLIVEIPTPPEYLTRLDQRCNYIVDNFWKRCNLKSAFSSLERLDATFGQFLAFTPYATADTVHMTIDNLIRGVEKANGKNLLPLAKIAEKWCLGDTAEYQSDELLYPFVKAVATSKKVKSPEKERFKALYRKMTNSRTGATVTNLTFTCPDGSQGSIDDIKTPHVLLYFYEPDCIDCRLARARLSADFILPTLIEANLLKIVAIFPGEPDDEWRADSESMPDGWVVGANPEIDMDFIIEHSPEIYYLDTSRKVIARNVSVDNALNAFRALVNAAIQNNATEQPGTETQSGEQPETTE